MDTIGTDYDIRGVACAIREQYSDLSAIVFHDEIYGLFGA